MPQNIKITLECVTNPERAGSEAMGKGGSPHLILSTYRNGKLLARVSTTAPVTGCFRQWHLLSQMRGVLNVNNCKNISTRYIESCKKHLLTVMFLMVNDPGEWSLDAVLPKKRKVGVSELVPSGRPLDLAGAASR